MSHPAEHRKHLLDVADILEKRSKQFERIAKLTPDEELSIIYESLVTLNYYLSRSYMLSANGLKELNVLFDAIENLPRKSEFDEIKNMVEKQRENIINTLIPIKEAFERSAEYENFGRKKTERDSE